MTQALRDACEKFAESRRIEGEKLAKDLSEKLDHISDLVDKIETRSPQIVEEYRKKITEKVEQLLGDTQIDENLLATEIVMFSDKICVDEEMVRLRTHVEHVKEIICGIIINRTKRYALFRLDYAAVFQRSADGVACR